MSNSSKGDSSQTANGQKHVHPSALELGPRKKLTTQDPLVHPVHTFCNVPMLLTNGIILLSEGGSDTLESLTVDERKEFAAFWELLRVVPGLESRLMASSEEEVVEIGELIQKGINGARADDTKGMKGAIIDWITPKGQSLSPHIPHNVKLGRGFNHEHTGALLCPAGDQWPVFLYADYSYDPEDPWNGLLQSGLLVSAYKHIFTSPSSIDHKLKATHSRNAHIHGMRCVTKVSIAYVAMQSNEVDQLITWWNRQVFPLYTTTERLPSKDSALARIHQKRAAYKELHDADRDS
ncbi:hypothetical protein BKA83DRAFT_4464947 [Pisolithus microcarpus]|nr:hypothetical protein BKA83DRAFT_4464947 [Pisolithus microcarpus]